MRRTLLVIALLVLLSLVAAGCPKQGADQGGDGGGYGLGHRAATVTCVL